MDKNFKKINTYQLYLNSARTLKISSRVAKAEANMIELIDASTQTNIKERKNMMMSLLLFPLFVLMSAVTLAYNSFTHHYNKNNNNKYMDDVSMSPKIEYYRCKRHSVCEPDSLYSSKESLNTLSPPNGLRLPRRSSTSRRRGSIHRTNSIHLSQKMQPKYISQDNYIWRIVMSPLTTLMLAADIVYNSLMMPVFFVVRLYNVLIGRQLEGGDVLDVCTEDIDSLSLTPAMLRRASTTRITPPFLH